jgi:UDP-glucose 4-epimerase
VTSYSGKRVVVTGAEGFIGSHLVELLAAQGAEVTALALYNSFDQAGWLDEIPPDARGAVRIVRGDVRDGPFMRRLCEGADVVFHLAALIAIPYSYEAASSYVAVNVQGTLNVLEAARAGGAGRVVHTSTSEVYGTARYEPIDEAHPLQAQSPYSASKIGADMMAESYARSFGAPVAILRPFNTFGPRQSERAVIPTVIRQALDPACSSIRIGDLSPRRDFVFVTDTAAAFAALGAAEAIEYGRPYNAGSGTAVTIGRMIEIAIRKSGVDKKVEVDVQRLRPEGSEVRALLANSRLFEAATGWRPRVSFEEGLERTLAWWRERLAAGRVRRGADYST